MRYTLEPVHEGYEILNGKPLGTLTNAIWQFPFRNLEEVINKMNRYSSLGAPKLAGKRVSMAGALGHGAVVVPQALHLQARLHRRLGRLRHRLGQFRGHVLPLRQALRRDARLAAAGEQADQAEAVETATHSVPQSAVRGEAGEPGSRHEGLSSLSSS